MKKAKKFLPKQLARNKTTKWKSKTKAIAMKKTRKPPSKKSLKKRRKKPKSNNNYNNNNSNKTKDKTNPKTDKTETTMAKAAEDLLTLNSKLSLRYLLIHFLLFLYLNFCICLFIHFYNLKKGLSFDATEDDLRTLFADCGNLDSLNLLKDRDSGRSKGIAFVRFGDEESLNSAVALSGSEHMGRQLYIEKS